MINRTTPFRLIALASLCSLFSGCVAGPLYEVNRKNPPPLSTAQAIRDFASLTKNAHPTVLEYAPRFQALKVIDVIKDGNLYVVDTNTPMSDPLHKIGFATLEQAKQFMDAVIRLSATVLEEIVSEVKRQAIEASNEFERSVAMPYRARALKPTLPEEAHRYQVQAEAAVAEKRPGDAISLYQKALEISPWWPEGHFNRAKLLADQNQFDEAVDEMKKYLLLDPNALDARAVQDKIYEWEAKIK